MFIYSEYEKYVSNTSETSLDEKFIETGTLINSVYETDGFSRIALLTQSDDDFDTYQLKVDSLFAQIEMIKKLSANEYQVKQLDCVRTLLVEKNKNIEQLRLLQITSSKDSSLDDILYEIKKLEESIGKTSMKEMINNPSKLSKKQQEFWQSYTDWFNSDVLKDDNKVKANTVDSMLTASRYIVREAKRENSKIRKSLEEKQNELIGNDLTISEQLRKIIAALDTEIKRNKKAEEANRIIAIERTSSVLRIVGIIGGLVILLFSYLIITDFFKAEKLKRILQEEKHYSDDLLKSREQLISTVSHDLKTPLNTILGYSELVVNTSLTDKQRHYVKQIASSSNFVTKLVDDLLDFSKLEAGKLTIEEIPFSLENLINQTAKASKELHIDKEVVLKVYVDDDLKDSLFIGDPLRLQQILNNLIGNAFKFTEKGSITVKASKGTVKGDTILAQISVQDTGIGISEEKIQSIFKEFTQAEVDTAKRFGGYGLGLAISKKLSELLHGKLIAESVLGKGSTFTLQIPLKISKKTYTAHKPKNTIQTFELKALVFDDDQSMLRLLEEVLLQMGIESTTCTDLQKAQNTEALEFDFVLTDIQMPNMDGFELLTKMKNGALEAYKDQPIIAMTGNREIGKAIYLEKGFAEMLRKPFSKEQLIDALIKLFPEKVSLKSINSSEAISETPQNNNTNIYNLTLLKSFVSDKDALCKLLKDYLKETEEDRIRLEQAISTNNYEAISNVSHKMLTMKRQLEAKKIIPILEQLEHATPQNLPEKKLKKLVGSLHKELNVLVEEIESEIS